MVSTLPADASQEDRFRAILAAAGASGTWDWDILSDRLYVDPRFAELYGLDEETARSGLATQTFFKAIHPDDRARMRIAVAGLLSGAELFSKEFRILAPDGAVLWMHGRGQSHFDDRDQPVRFTGLLVDVTERKRTEERLRVAQSAGGVGTFEYADGFATATVSDEFCRLLGLHPTRVLPVPTINGVVRYGQAIIPDSAALDSLDAEFRILRSDDGAERWIARRGEIIREDGVGYRLIGVIYDVTASKALEAELREINDTLELRIAEALAERHQAEEALRQAQKMEAVGQLTGGIAHDFNNLLTIIIGNIDTIGRRLDSTTDPRVRRSLDHALKGAERAASLTQRLLAFSRQQPLDPRSIDVENLLVGMSDLLTRSITEEIAVQIAAEPGLWQIEADPHQLENAILNLAVNARDAMPGGGTLSVKARNLTIAPGEARPEPVDAGDYVAIEVIDSGTGMPPELIARVFDPFFTTKDVGKGTGLGLSMVYGFVKQSGGQVEIDSTPGSGTCVRLLLPRQQRIRLPAAEEGVPLATPPTGSETILVVEDDDEVRAYTVGILRELGYRVIEAHDGTSALRLLKRPDQELDMMLTDVIMPKISGPELADQAREIHPSLKVLYTSGYTRDAIMRDGRLEAGVDLLSKPFTYVVLAAKMRDLLDR